MKMMVVLTMITTIIIWRASLAWHLGRYGEELVHVLLSVALALLALYLIGSVTGQDGQHSRRTSSLTRPSSDSHPFDFQPTTSV